MFTLAFLDWLTYQGLLDAIHDAAVWVFDFLKEIVVTLLGSLFGALTSAISTLAGYLSDAVSLLGSYTTYLAFANAWFPVDLLFQLLYAYAIFWLALIVYKVVKSWIPFVSG